MFCHVLHTSNTQPVNCYRTGFVCPPKRRFTSSPMLPPPGFPHLQNSAPERWYAVPVRELRSMEHAPSACDVLGWTSQVWTSWAGRGWQHWRLRHWRCESRGRGPVLHASFMKFPWYIAMFIYIYMCVLVMKSLFFLLLLIFVILI